jgi:hypothetical protein
VLLLARTRRELPSTWLFSFWLFYLARLLLQGADFSCDIGAVTSLTASMAANAIPAIGRSPQPVT